MIRFLTVLATLLLAVPSGGQEIQLFPKTVKKGVEAKGLRSVNWEHFDFGGGRVAEIVQYFVSDGKGCDGKGARRLYVEAPGDHLAVLDTWVAGPLDYGAKFEDVESGWWATWTAHLQVHDGLSRAQDKDKCFGVFVDLNHAMREGRVHSEEVFETSDGLRLFRVAKAPSDFAHGSHLKLLDAFHRNIKEDRRDIWPPLPETSVKELAFLLATLSKGRDTAGYLPEVDLAEMALAVAAKVNSGETRTQAPGAEGISLSGEVVRGEPEFHPLYVATRGEVVRMGSAEAFVKRFGDPYAVDAWHGLEDRLENDDP